MIQRIIKTFLKETFLNRLEATKIEVLYPKMQHDLTPIYKYFRVKKNFPCDREM